MLRAAGTIEITRDRNVPAGLLSPAGWPASRPGKPFKSDANGSNRIISPNRSATRRIRSGRAGRAACSLRAAPNSIPDEFAVGRQRSRRRRDANSRAASSQTRPPGRPLLAIVSRRPASPTGAPAKVVNGRSLNSAAPRVGPPVSQSLSGADSAAAAAAAAAWPTINCKS